MRFGSTPAAPSLLLHLGARRVGELTGTFAGYLGQHWSALAGDFGPFGAAFTGRLGQHWCALAGDFGPFGAAFTSGLG